MEKQNTKRMKLPTIQGALRDQKDALTRSLKQREELTFLQQERKLNSSEKAQLGQVDEQIRRLEDAIDRGENVLAAVEKEAA